MKRCRDEEGEGVSEEEIHKWRERMIKGSKGGWVVGELNVDG